MASPLGELLAAHDLRYAYGERLALAGLSFTTLRGEVFGVLGPNGAGKSTLFQLLSGLLRPLSGTLSLDGQPVLTTSRQYRARLGVVFQSPSLDLKLTGRENLALGGSLYGVPRRLLGERIDRALALIELGDRQHDRVESYSGGMRRRLELGRVLLHEPSLLIMDEPTQGLDLASARRFWSHLAELKRARDLTVLVTTHDPAEAEACDRLLVLDQGRAIAEGTPAELKRAVGGDIITISGQQDDVDEAREIAQRVEAGLAEVLAAPAGDPRAAQGGPPVQVLGTRVVVERVRGHELIPRIVELFPAGRLRSVSMHPPSLADAFVKLTGRALDHGHDPMAAPGVVTRVGQGRAA